MSFFKQASSAIQMPRVHEPGKAGPTDAAKTQPKPSAGRQSIQLVFNPDLRRPVSDTTISPLRAIADLLIDVGGPTPEYATGWFLSPNVVVTAAHVLSYVNNEGGIVLAQRVRVIPGRNVNAAPFGVFDSTKTRVSAGWLPNRDLSTDYGAIHLDQPVGNSVGWFGCGIFTDAQIAASQFNLIGYPIDKQPLGSMWGEAGSAIPEANQIGYGMSSYPGQSGCPLYAAIEGNAWVAGIHSGGQGSANYAVRITQTVFDELMSWKD